MKIDRRTFIRKMNWGLAGIIGMLGFSGCEKDTVTSTNFFVKGTVVNKANGKPIKGIRVGFSCEYCPVPMYGIKSTTYKPKSHVLTNSKGEFKLIDRFRDNEIQIIDNKPVLPVFVEDLDEKANGLFQTEYLQVEFNKGVYTATVKVELTEIENE